MRVRRVCSSESDFERHAERLESAFCQRGYRPAKVKESINRARQVERSEALRPKLNNKPDRVPFVITHNPANPPVQQWLAKAHEHLHLSDRMKSAVPNLPIIGRRNPPSLRNILMPSNLPPLNPSPPSGVTKCTKSCIICTQHIVESKFFSSDNTREVFKVNTAMSCDSSNIVYLLFCHKCKQSQYIGETQNSLKQRFYLHRSDIKRNQGRCTHVNNHFNGPDHSLSDLRCLPIEEISKECKKTRKSREQFWIAKMKTLHPFGLNIYEK